MIIDRSKFDILVETVGDGYVRIYGPAGDLGEIMFEIKAGDTFSNALVSQGMADAFIEKVAQKLRLPK